jgi:predicted deacylase
MPTTTFEWVPVTTLASGGELRLPLHTLRGAHDGPTLGLSALVHGNEPAPSLGIIRALLERIDPAELRGTVLAMPVLNPLGAAAQLRHTPEDGLNLNAAFVTSDAGGHPEPVKTVSVQVAAAISEGFLGRLNYQIDFHTGGNASVHMIEFTDDPESRAMARAFNMPILLRDVWLPGQMWGKAEELGVKVIVAELGGAGQRYAEWVERGVAGALNVMRLLGMLPGDVAPPPRQYVVNNLPGHEENLMILCLRGPAACRPAGARPADQPLRPDGAPGVHGALRAHTDAGDAGDADMVHAGRVRLYHHRRRQCRGALKAQSI